MCTYTRWEMNWVQSVWEWVELAMLGIRHWMRINIWIHIARASSLIIQYVVCVMAKELYKRDEDEKSSSYLHSN